MHACERHTLWHVSLVLRMCGALAIIMSQQLGALVTAMHQMCDNTGGKERGTATVISVEEEQT